MPGVVSPAFAVTSRRMPTDSSKRCAVRAARAARSSCAKSGAGGRIVAVAAAVAAVDGPCVPLPDAAGSMT